MKLFFSLFLLVVNLIAQEDYSFRIAYGKVTTSDLGEIFLADIGSHPEDLTVFSLDAGYLLNESIFELPIDFYLKGGLSYFDEGGTNLHAYHNGTEVVIYEGDTRDNVYEGTLYIKFYYNINFSDNRIRIGLGEGISYTSSVLWTEEKEAAEKNDHHAQFLNYLDISFDFDIGKLVRYEPLYNTYIGWTIKHRSGIGGLINNVKHGGSNYNTISIEKNF